MTFEQATDRARNMLNYGMDKRHVQSCLVESGCAPDIATFAIAAAKIMEEQDEANSQVDEGQG